MLKQEWPDRIILSTDITAPFEAKQSCGLGSDIENKPRDFPDLDISNIFPCDDGKNSSKREAGHQMRNRPVSISGGKKYNGEKVKKHPKIPNRLLKRLAMLKCPARIARSRKLIDIVNLSTSNRTTRRI